MNQKDIAKLAGVSVSTVSRVLADKDSKAASQETKERIWKIVHKTDYTPDENGRKLRNTNKNKNKPSYIACVYAMGLDSRPAFFSEMASAIEFELFKSRYIMKYTLHAANMDVATFKESLANRDLAGVIVMGRFDNPNLNEVVESMKNVVFVGLNCLSETHDVVFCEAYKAAQLAMQEVYQLGHRRIAYMGEISRERRYTGFLDFIAEKNLKKMVCETRHTLQGGYQAMDKLLREDSLGFTALFAANDEVAGGAIKALHEHGIKVPDDISVISVDDTDMARYYTPMLTTVHIPIRELGKQAARTLIDRLENNRTIPLRVELPISLSRRDSTRQIDMRSV